MSLIGFVIGIIEINLNIFTFMKKAHFNFVKNPENHVSNFTHYYQHW